ncbi:MAG: DUF4954 family protein [Chitinispirillaceae bacterium]|nr:DUF4954 family protein [Chitinispirillaceae bacterium]
MDNVEIIPKGSIGRDFIPPKFLPDGEDEYYLRNRQIKVPPERWRHLRPDEIELLTKYNNTADSWNTVLVSNDFDPNLIRDTEFFGLVRIGALRNVTLRHHDLQMPAGITKSRIVSCDIGDDTAIHDVRYCAHYIIGNRCILASIDEMHTTNHSKFGNGILKDGEDEEVRVWIEVMNETGGRKVMPFDGMIPADAYLWAKYRDDAPLQKKLAEITQRKFDSHRGYYGEVGDQCVIKNSGILKDVKIGDCCYIKGANKIKNITINSTADEQTQIGEGVELVNGIIGRGCHVFYGCKAIRFILGDNSNLKYGARLINSFLGENSTISCCEVLNNLIFPAHEQHHNNSFLIASVCMGQSNIAAGATIGSNHNSRSNDNEIQAGRGFWPGLCTSVKHSCRFASFVLLAKADYPAEMDIPLPFSLVNNDNAKNRLEIMPAYWWLYNMYALARNSWKFKNRDKRKYKAQHVEFDPFAPDTAEEILRARRLLEIWAARATPRNKNVKKEEELARIGRELLTKNKKRAQALEVPGEGIEKSKRKTVVISAAEGYNAYGDMLLYYAVKNCVEYMLQNDKNDFTALSTALKGKRELKWTNLGGQLVPAREADRLRADIGSGTLVTWDDIHERYDRLWEAYPRAKQRHAFAVLCGLLGADGCPTRRQWLSALDKAITIQEYIRDQVYRSRKKDDDNPFRRATFRTLAEMKATVGTAEDNGFVKQVIKDTGEFKKMVEEIKKRG